MTMHVWLSTWRRLLVRMCHAVLTGVVVLPLVICDTALRDSFLLHTHISYALVYTILLALAISLYYVASFTDPGFVVIKKEEDDVTTTTDEDEEEETARMTESADMLENGVTPRECGFCGVIQPLRARHCEECGRCVRRYDHHCPWLANCVGERNHRFFFAFLFTKTVIIAWSAIIVKQALVSQPTVYLWLRHNLVLAVCGVALLLCGGMAGCLTAIHAYLTVSGTTSWEYAAHARITYLRHLPPTADNPFDEGCTANLRRFFCHKGATYWESLYAVAATRWRFEPDVAAA